MPRQQRERSQSGYYHIMLRGNERKNIFLEDEDKLRFIETIAQKKEEQRFYLHAFCLMDNHIHLMLSEGTEDIAKVIKRIAVSYVFYFNKKYKRVGHLFQDRFKSELVEEDRYVLALARYIHQNPVKAGMVSKPSGYKWSSYNGYLNKEKDISKVLDTGIILGLFSNDSEKAKTLFIEYMNDKNNDRFIEMQENEEESNEARALEEYKKLLEAWGIKDGTKEQIPEKLIKELKAQTNLSLRKLAAITGLNKDRINKILKS